MMDDDKKTPQGFDDSFDEHELDLNTPEDLKAIEDVSFSDPGDKDSSTESMAIFDEFDDSNDFGEFEEMAPKSEPAAKSEFAAKSDFGASTDSFSPHAEDEDFFKDDDSSFEPTTNDSMMTDEEMFSSDAFEDVTSSDFPEGESSQSLGDSQLFDYDAGATSTDENMGAEEIYAGSVGELEQPEKAAKRSKTPGEMPGFLKSRRTVRVVVMLILVGAVYGGLRVFMGGNATTMTATPTHAAKAPTEITAPAPTAAKPATPPLEAAPAHEMAQAPEPVPAQPHEAANPATNLPAPGAVAAPHEMAAAAPAPTPVAPAPALHPAQHPASALTQGPETSLNLPAPGTSMVPTAPALPTGMTAHPPTAVATAPAPAPTAPAGSDQIANKLSSLEASINAIDDRLATIAKTPAGVKGSEPAGPGNTFGKAAPESQEVLMEALSKIEGIDKKMSYLAELQTQVHILNKEVSALKSDVVQQSIIVGQSQAHINQNLVALIDANAPKMMVQAAIPGRAWLRSETGQLITVIPGDEVAGYGRVVSIDPTTGTVVMSSRAVFREQ